MKTAYSYTRVSTTGQALDGVSLEVQQSLIAAWCERGGYPLKESFTDAGISGKETDNRPGLQSAIAKCGKGDVLVVYSLSRLARNTLATLQISKELEKKGAALVSLAENLDATTPTGAFTFTMMAAVAQLERDQTAARTCDALAALKAKGQRVGSVAYGYSLAADGKSLVENPTEQKVIETARELHTAGLSLRKVADALSAYGFSARNGGKFGPSQISNMLKAA